MYKKRIKTKYKYLRLTDFYTRLRKSMRDNEGTNKYRKFHILGLLRCIKEKEKALRNHDHM